MLIFELLIMPLDTSHHTGGTHPHFLGVQEWICSKQPRWLVHPPTVTSSRFPLTSSPPGWSWPLLPKPHSCAVKQVKTLFHWPQNLHWTTCMDGAAGHIRWAEIKIHQMSCYSRNILFSSNMTPKMLAFLLSFREFLPSGFAQKKPARDFYHRLQPAPN